MFLFVHYLFATDQRPASTSAANHRVQAQGQLRRALVVHIIRIVFGNLLLIHIMLCGLYRSYGGACGSVYSIDSMCACDQSLPVSHQKLCSGY